MVVDVSVADFDLWVAPRIAPLLRFAYLVTGSRETAQDAVQDALASACASWERVGATDDPDQYVRRMIANAHISAWRRFGRRQSPVADPTGAHHLGDSHLGDSHFGDHAAAVADRDAVWRVCRNLPQRQRAAVVLRFYLDLDYPEIAATLECADATARSLVHRGLAALRAELEQQEADHA